MRVVLHQLDESGGDDVPLDVGKEGVLLGRGSTLRIDATSISRKHVSVNLKDGKLVLKCLHRNPVKVVTGGSEVEVSKDQENEVKDGDVIKFCEDKFHYSIDLLTDESDNETDKMSAPSSPEKSRAKAISDQSKPLKSKSLVEIPPSPKLKKSRPDLDPSQDDEPESQNHLRGESEKEKSSPKPRQEKYEPEPEKPIKVQSKSETVESLSEKSTQNQEGHSVKSKPQSEKDNVNAHGSKLNEIKPNHKPEAEKQKQNPKVEPQEDEKENKKPSKPAPVSTGVESGSNKKPFKSSPVATGVESGSNKKPRRKLPDWMLKNKKGSEGADSSGNWKSSKSPGKGFTSKKSSGSGEGRVSPNAHHNVGTKPKHPENQRETGTKPKHRKVSGSKDKHNTLQKPISPDSARKLKTTPPKKNSGSTTPPGAKSPKGSDESDGHKSKDESDGEDSKPSGSKFPVVITPSDLEDSDEEKPAKPKPKPKPKNRKRPCRHGASCYRKNPSHFKEYSHPGDLDYQSKDEDTDEDDSRPECEHGTACYRKNPEHIKNYKHTRVPQPKRRAKVDALRQKKKKDEDVYESDFIDDSDEFEPVDDSDDDEDYNPKKEKNDDD